MKCTLKFYILNHLKFYILNQFNTLFPLDQYQWYRRFYGGYWELWHVEIVGGFNVWHYIDDVTNQSVYYQSTGRPTPLCRGIPLKIEAWI